MTKYLLISLGAILGANARYLVGVWFADRGWATFPWGTLTANLTGAFILSFFLTLTTERLVADPNYRFLVAVGFCGSYTTFSSLTYETFTQWGTNGWWPAVLNLMGSMLLGMLAVLAGVIAARMI
ncbi:MAG: fluoride efflux transporter CrcB [Anaerolineae bacterium]|nr:fluoride efflux transporter CrcB [Anaerolineae bacterium]